MTNLLFFLCFSLAVLVSVKTSAAQTPQALAPLDTGRVKAVAAMLPEKPAGPGRPITDRAVWDARARQPHYRAVVQRAEALLKQPLPEQSDDLYLEFSRTGNRTRFQNVASARRGRLVPLALAECAENQGRFVPAIEALIDALSAERTWVLPAHDTQLKNFNGEITEVDLVSSALAWNLALTDYLLGERLRPTVRRTLRAHVTRRVLEPYRAMINGQSPAVFTHGHRAPSRAMFWLTGSNNWNAVCLAGVTGAALALIESRAERAEFVAAAERYSQNFLSGFTPDGYCSEGLGYWNYGFGHYVLLTETIRRATDGGLDLLAVPEARLPAAFAARIQIIEGISPAFADCGVFAKPAPALMHYLNRRFGLGLTGYGPETTQQIFGSLFETLLYGFEESAPPPVAGKKIVANAASGPALRDWFDKAGVLVGRPLPGSSSRLGVALKGGHNAEHHNHNDLGSYVLVSGERPVLLDPGSETYTARTFSPRRYESRLLNSFGHAVPLVAGTLQRTGRQAEARVLRADFTEGADTLQFDLTAAYPVADLQSLHRTFVYSRRGAGSLIITDHLAMKSPQTFGTALVTLGSWQRQPNGSLLIYDGEEALRVEIDTGGRAFTVDAEEIREEAPVVPTRIGINLSAPVTEATIRLTITPMETLPETSGGLLRNGGFEVGSWAWEMPKNGMGSLSTERAASGAASLRIRDRDPNLGSNIASARIPVAGSGPFVVRGKVFHASGTGIGLYVRCLDAQRTLLNPTDAAGNILPVGTLAGAEGKWEPFSFRFPTPPGTVFLQVWLHSFNRAQVDAYLDDLEIVPDKGA